MPNVMIRKEADTGNLTLYIAKKDLEETVTSIEFNEETRWGGQFDLADGSSFYIDPLDAPPKLPITLRARRA